MDKDTMMWGALAVVLLVFLGSQVMVLNAINANNDKIAALIAASAAGSKPAVAQPTVSLPKGLSLIEGGSSCSAGGKPKVEFFHDVYCPACIASEPAVNDFVDKFKGVSSISYRLVLTHSEALIRKYGADKVTLAHKYMLAAQDQGIDKVQAFKKAFAEQLKDDGQDYVPFTEEQLKALAKTAGMDQAKVDAYLPKAQAQMDKDREVALTYGGGTYSTPMMTVDCKYTGHSAYTKSAVCYAFPNTQGC